MRRRLDLKTTAEQFKLEIDDILLTIREMIEEGSQHGIIDADNQEFYHLTEEENQNLLNLLSKEKIQIAAIAQEMEIPPKAIKEWLLLLINSKHLHGTFDEKGAFFIPYNLVLQQVKDSFEKSGKLGTVEAATALQLSPKMVNDCINILIDEKKLTGFYTVDHEFFITTKRLNEDIIDYLTEEKQIPLPDLAARLRIGENIVRQILDTLILTGKVNGALSINNEFISDELLNDRLVEAVKPYSRVSISELATNLGLTEQSMKRYIARAISKGIIFGSIDSVNNEFVKDRGVVAPTPTIPTSVELIDVKRDYDYIGGDIRFKIAIQNITKTTVSKISVLLNVPDQFQINRNVEKVEILNPNETRGIDFILTPLACGKGQIFGTVSYTDAYGEPHSVTIRPKEVWVKCPLVKSQETSASEADLWRQELQKSTTTIDSTGITKAEAFRIACEQIAALDLAEVQRNDETFQATFSGIAKVTGNRLLVEISTTTEKLILDVYTTDQKQATGLLAYMRNLIKISLDVSRKLRVKSEKLGVKVLTSFQIAQSLFNICDNCEIRAPICDFLLLMKELIFKITKEFPEVKFLSELMNWLEELNNLDENEPIPETHANSLEYDTIRWLKEIESLAENTAKIYLDSFDTPSETRERKIRGGLYGINQKIEQKEANYSLRVARYLLIIYKTSGLCIYNYKFSPGEVDPDLLSGFLQAIQSFGTEFSSTEEAGMQRLSYKDFEISLEEGPHIRTALVGVGKITPYLQDRLKDFVKLFSNQFQTDLEQFSGNIQVFYETDKLIKNIFGLD
ncbi:MAG: PCI domain-containing protein [Candidatus Helarchaeota archaeon]